jgi:hypothetical protein
MTHESFLFLRRVFPMAFLDHFERHVDLLHSLAFG